jgi:hypothetical protein
MADTENTINTEKRLSGAAKDLIILGLVVIVVFILSYYFDVFILLMKLFQKNPGLIIWIDEIISGLVALSICLAVFAWRRWLELKKETAGRIELQEQLIMMAETKAETANIICKELRSEIEYHRKMRR